MTGGPVESPSWCELLSCDARELREGALSPSRSRFTEADFRKSNASVESSATAVTLDDVLSPFDSLAAVGAYSRGGNGE